MTVTTEAPPAEAAAVVEALAEVIAEPPAPDPKVVLIGEIKEMVKSHLHTMDTIRMRVIQQANRRSMCQDGVDTFLLRCKMPKMLSNGTIYNGDAGERLNGQHPECVYPYPLPEMDHPEWYTTEGLEAVRDRVATEIKEHREVLYRRCIRAAVDARYVGLDVATELLENLGFPPYVPQSLHSVSVSFSFLVTGEDQLTDDELNTWHKTMMEAFPRKVDQVNHRDSTSNIRNNYGHSLSGPLPEEGERGWHSYD